MIKAARILLVEDDEDDFILTSDSLSQLDSYNFDIQWVTNSEQALEKLLPNDFDICLLDYQLGAQSGLDVLRKAAELGCLTPIIMLTGQTDDTLDKSALALGAVDYLNKEEISTDRFARAVRYALARQDVATERLERLKAETQNRSKDRFLAHLSHELRTPLTSILGYTELLLNRDQSHHFKSELNIILSNGKHLLSLLNDVLDLSKIAADKLELNCGPINLDSFIADVFFLLQINAHDKGLELVIEAKTDLPLIIFSDATRLRQILINLTYNAIKFTDKGTVSIYISMPEATPDNPAPLLHFDVVDTGKGISAENLSSIFEPFEQIEDIITRKETGAGLGLAICTELVKRMGGVLQVESQLGQGSCFSFDIDPGDVSNSEKQHLSFEKALDSELVVELEKLTGRILVVDDAPDIRSLIEQLCVEFGLHVETATNGLEAIEKCRQSIANQQPYDLVLMDIHMPILDGRQAISKIRPLGFNSPVIAVTAAALKGVKQSLLDIGFTAVLHKPLNKAAMYAKISQYLTADKTPVEHNHEQKIPANSASGPSILLVEDDQDAATITQCLLESLGAQVDIALSGDACIKQLLKGASYERILVDLHLPDMTGWQLIAQISPQLEQTKITIVSGSEVELQALKQAGVEQALLKPLNMQMLQQLLR